MQGDSLPDEKPAAVGADPQRTQYLMGAAKELLTTFRLQLEAGLRRRWRPVVRSTARTLVSRYNWIISCRRFVPSHQAIPPAADRPRGVKQCVEAC